MVICSNMEPETRTVTTKGQVTIPSEYRRKLDISPGEMVRFILVDDLIILDPKGKISELRGALKPYAKKGVTYKKEPVRALMVRDAVSRYRGRKQTKR